MGRTTGLKAVDPIAELRRACDRAGSQRAWARLHEFSAGYVANVLNGREEPSPRLLAALGLERVIHYRRAAAVPPALSGQ